MKKLLTLTLALMLVSALAVSALAYPMYVKSDPGKVHNQPSKHSDCISRLPFGDLVEVWEVGGDWSHINYVNKKGVAKSGWIKTKSLTDKKPCHHEWSPWRITVAPTCTKGGKKEHHCVKCGATQTKDVKKTGHSWTDWSVTRDATCVSPGERARTCVNCGKRQTEAFYADHQFGDWVVVREATCTEAGLREHTCVVCGLKEERAIDKLPHDFEYQIIQPATDHSSGTRASVCRVCGYTEAAVSYDPDGTLRRKDRGEAVYTLQQKLAEQGYLNANGADGVFGGATEKAVMQFQEDQGLNPDGVAWPQTQAMLTHDFGPWETVKQLTRTEPGERRRVCKDCGYEQYETVESGDTIERGARGEHIRAMQQILKQLGYDAGGFDGIYGKKLDAAFSRFCADKGLTFTDGKVIPYEIDALVNAWFAASPEAIPEGSEGSPVNMALSVTAAADEAADANATTYTWSLTNLGSDKCMFTVMLLTYGKNPDFTADNLVMDLDGFELKPKAGNSASGSFTVAKSWGDGNLNFAAMGIDEKTGQKWLSNTVVFEMASEGEPKTVAPATVEINVAALPDGTYNVSFDRGDIASVTSGIYMNAVHIYTPDVYAASDIDSLTAGDTVVVKGEAIAVTAVERAGGALLVNGGLDEGGVTFAPTGDGTGWQVADYDDATTWTDQGMTTLMVDPAVVYTDASDLDNGPVTAGYDHLVETIMASENDSYTVYGTTLTLKGGKVVEIYRGYTP